MRRSRSLAAAVAFSLLVACRGTSDNGSADATELREGGSVTFASDREPTGWNINTATDNSVALGIIVQHVYPQTFEVTPDFEVVMNDDLLVRAEHTSDDPQTVEYVIRDEAVWSDGTPISADDFVYVWQQSLNPDNDVASRTGFEDIESVTGSEDGKTVTVVFSRPFAEWQGIFNDLLPAHIMTTLPGGWNDGLDGTQIPSFSGGPFLLEDYVPDQSIKMVRNTAYRGDRKPTLDQVIIRFGITADAIAAALENEEVHVAYPQAQLHLVDEIERLAPDIQLESNVGLTFEHIDFDLENAFLKDFAVRQAIAYALDERQLVNRTARQFTDDAAPLYNRIYVPGQPEYEEHGEAYHGVDVAKAKATLEAAGFTLGEDNVYTRDGNRLALRISTTSGNALRETTEEIIQTQLAAAGIEIQIDNEEVSVFPRLFPDRPEDRDFDIALFAWVTTPYASANRALYTTGSGSNEMHYSNETVDDLFDTAIRVLDPAAADDLYNQIDEVMWDELPTIPLYQQPTLLAYSSMVANVEDSASLAGPLWNMYDWGLKKQ